MAATPHRAARPTLLVILMTMLLATLVPATANAASSFTYRMTGKSASTQWTQVDGTPTGGPLGNTHVGWLNAEETSRGKAGVFGWIEDWDCDPGETPGWGGHGEPVDGLCDYVGGRYIESYDVPFSMDKKLNSARLTGRLTVYGGGHDGGGVVGQPMADIVWTGVGSTSKGSYTSRWRDGNTWYSESYRGSNRSATMSGTLGPMGFDPNLSSGYLATFASTSRSRTR